MILWTTGYETTHNQNKCIQTGLSECNKNVCNNLRSNQKAEIEEKTMCLILVEALRAPPIGEPHKNM